MSVKREKQAVQVAIEARQGGHDQAFAQASWRVCNNKYSANSMTTDFTSAAARGIRFSHQLSTLKTLRLARCALGLALTMTLAGCGILNTGSTDAGAAVRPPSPQALPLQRETTLQAAWRGRPYEALLDTYGPPKLMMNILGYRPLRTSLVVYGIVDQAANCVDAFTMVKNEQTGQWSVADYFCR